MEKIVFKRIYSCKYEVEANSVLIYCNVEIVLLKDLFFFKYKVFYTSTMSIFLFVKQQYLWK